MSENKKDNLVEQELAEIEKEANSSATETIKEVSEKKKGSARIRGRGLRFGAYSAALIAGFVAVVIAVNVMFGLLADRISLKSDLTSDEKYTISEENKNFIKDSVNGDIIITVFCTREQYTQGEFAYYRSQSGVMDPSEGQYYKQAIMLLDEYTKLNPRISLKFIDLNKPEAETIASKYQSQGLGIGDFIVEGTNAEGKTRDEVLGYDKLFSIETDQNYGAQYLTGSIVESAVTSAIYRTLSGKLIKVSVYTGNGCSGDISRLTDLLGTYNYELSSFDNLTTGSIPADTDLVIMASPTLDISDDIAKKLNDFLENGGEKGKNLLYFAKSGAVLSNLNAFMEQWNINQKDGSLYETESELIYKDDPGYIYNRVGDELPEEYLNRMTTTSGKFIASGNAVLERGSDATSTEMLTLLVAAPSVVVRPSNADNNWKAPTPAEDAAYPVTGLLAKRTVTSYEAGTTPGESHILAFSSADALNPVYSSDPTIISHEVIFSILDNVVNTGSLPFSIQAKTIENPTFTPNESSSNFMFYMFTIILPLAILGAGIVIWLRRQHS